MRLKMKLKSVMNSAPFKGGPFLTWWLPILLGMPTTNTAGRCQPTREDGLPGLHDRLQWRPLGELPRQLRGFSYLDGERGGTDDDLLGRTTDGDLDRLSHARRGYWKPTSGPTAVFRSSTASDRFIDITAELPNDIVVA